ncbi:MAG: methyltransferase, partial [Chitinophagales bacterium]
MSNTYFQFKQFRIDQDQSAMKVATDACILGAATPAPADGAILDIGTGTGLLSLMIAQKCSGRIDAVELDEGSFHQATSNVQNSLWKDRINVIHSDVRTFHPNKKYDLIICNPPFFENHFKSPFLQKNKAKHAVQLSY